ncbi:MAG: hypothetical protein IMZ47_06330 [Firmicutes bacterium]|nr:hypothetical protein [Bacillota bacterium]
MLGGDINGVIGQIFTIWRLEGRKFTEPVGLTKVKLHTSGKIYAVSYCNIHGLWESSVDVTVE